MKYQIATIVALLGLVGIGTPAAAQDTQETIDQLRAECTMLEMHAAPAVIDCAQALEDAEHADSPEALEDILRRYRETASPYDFERTVTEASRTNRTLFD